MYEFERWPGMKGELLDAYLAMGWYRMGPLVFTTNAVALENQPEYPVYWLRYDVPAVKLNKKNTKLNAANACFTTHWRRLELDDEVESLFSKYRSALKFNTGPTLEHILGNNTTFDSVLIEVRDMGRLVAAGVVDIGDTSIEGIVNCYDPGYSRYSMGKYLILKEYEFCVANEFKWFYPGYYMPGRQVFGYKLFLDKAATEVYLADEEEWVNFLKLPPEFAPGPE